MKPVYALYSDGHAAQRAVDALRKAGFSDGDITVITGEPMEDFEFSHIGHRNPLWYVASGGGLLGLLGSTWLTTFTEKDWPINVGNMATVAWFPNLIVIFEMTMLGAILATVVTLIITGGLARRKPAFYDPEVTNGKIFVGVENPREGSMADVERALLSTPGVSIKTV
jgi:Alternative complex III, ActD subunit